jgi:hypothetical protein
LSSASGSLDPFFHFDTSNISDYVRTFESGDATRILNAGFSRIDFGVTGTISYGPWSISSEVTLRPESQNPYLSVDDLGLNFGFLHDIHVAGGTFEISASAGLVLGRGTDGDLDHVSGGGRLGIAAFFSPRASVKRSLLSLNPAVPSCLVYGCRESLHGAIGGGDVRQHCPLRSDNGPVLLG